MSTLKQLTEDTTDRQQNQKLAHLKTYTFFIFHLLGSSSSSRSCLQKLNFKLRDPKGSLLQPKHQNNREAQLLFYDLNIEAEVQQGIIDLKTTALQTKAKIVAFCNEEALLQLVQKAHALRVELQNLPLVIADHTLHPDLALFTGWEHPNPKPFQDMPMGGIEDLSRKWIKSSQQKVDAWTVRILLKQGGRLEKLQKGVFHPVQTGLSFQLPFLSHLSLGHHARTSQNFQQRRRDFSDSTTNGLVYRWQRFKQFCCLGPSNMRTSTGVISISFVDQKGRETQILKHLREYDGSEQSQLEASKVVKSDRGIYSLLLANIDRFHGNKLEGLNCKPGDGKIEVVIFEGVQRWKRLCAASGEVLLRTDAQCLDLQIGGTVYRGWGVHQLRVSQTSRLRLAISRQVLSC